MGRHKFKKGYTPWNKGLTKETDKRLVRSAEYVESISGRGNSFYGRTHTIESKKKISENREYLKGEENHSFGLHIWDKKEHPRGMLGKENKWGKHNKEAIVKIKKARKKQIFPLKDSSIEVKIQKFLKQIEHGYQCDILIPGMNLVIECDGDYWHGNQKLFLGEKLTDRMLMQMEKDKFRTEELTKKGFHVIRLWESEIKEMDINDFRDRIVEYGRIDTMSYQNP